METGTRGVPDYPRVQTVVYSEGRGARRARSAKGVKMDGVDGVDVRMDALASAQAQDGTGKTEG